MSCFHSDPFCKVQKDGNVAWCQAKVTGSTDEELSLDGVHSMCDDECLIRTDVQGDVVVSCLMLAVALVLHCGPQPRKALLAIPLPQQHIIATIVEVNAELADARAVHVVVEAKTLRPPGAPDRSRQQADALSGEQERRLHVQVVSCQRQPHHLYANRAQVWTEESTSATL